MSYFSFPYHYQILTDFQNSFNGTLQIICNKVDCITTLPWDTVKVMVPYKLSYYRYIIIIIIIII